MSTQPPPEIIAAAQAAQVRWQVPASISIAQWALESAWGASTPPGSNNPFGIKALAGQPYVNAETREYLHGQWCSIVAAFRQFDSLADAFDAHGELLATKPIYAPAMAAGSPDAFAAALTGTYATDPHYGQSLVAVMVGSNLYQYDTAAPAAETADDLNAAELAGTAST